jgi:predicted HTH transcriptional regulator
LIESERIELKKGFNPEAILHSMCAFANDFNTIGTIGTGTAYIPKGPYGATMRPNLE